MDAIRPAQRERERGWLQTSNQTAVLDKVWPIPLEALDGDGLAIIGCLFQKDVCLDQRTD